MPAVLKSILLLSISNIFMTFAWYAHLKNLGSKPWYIAAFLSWLVAFLEYMFQVPGNRIGFIDFGIIGRLSQRRRNQLLVLIGAMLKQDADGLMAVLLDWTGASNPDLTKLQVSA